MHAELLSKIDNTVRTIEIRIGLTGAPVRHYCGRTPYQPSTLRVTYTKYGNDPWEVTDADLSGCSVLRSGKLGTREIVENLIVRRGEVAVSDSINCDDPFIASPAIAALVIEYTPQES